MNSDAFSVSSLTTEPENLTALLLESGLQLEHENRRTNLGLVIRETNLPGFVPTPPSKRPTTSWVWLHGHAVSFKDSSNNLTAQWLCRSCYTKTLAAKPTAKISLTSDFVYPANPTNVPMRHMESKHGYLSDGTLPTEVYKRSKKRTITEAFNAIDTANNRTFNRGAW
jgi:hypothetical protein